MRESQSSTIQLDYVSTEALRQVLEYLYTGTLPIDGTHWLTLLEISSLAKQYMLPTIDRIISDRLTSELQPHDLGEALSYSVHQHLDLAIKKIWLSMPTLVTHPLDFHTGFCPSAISFCLDQACCIGIGYPEGFAHSALGSSCTSAETEALTAVLQWVLHARSTCSACQATAPAARLTHIMEATGNTVGLHQPQQQQQLPLPPRQQQQQQVQWAQQTQQQQQVQWAQQTQQSWHSQQQQQQQQVEEEEVDQEECIVQEWHVTPFSDIAAVAVSTAAAVLTRNDCCPSLDQGKSYSINTTTPNSRSSSSRSSSNSQTMAGFGRVMGAATASGGGGGGSFGQSFGIQPQHAPTPNPNNNSSSSSSSSNMLMTEAGTKTSSSCAAPGAAGPGRASSSCSSSFALFPGSIWTPIATATAGGGGVGPPSPVKATAVGAGVGERLLVARAAAGVAGAFDSSGIGGLAQECGGAAAAGGTAIAAAAGAGAAPPPAAAGAAAAVGAPAAGLTAVAAPPTAAVHGAPAPAAAAPVVKPAVGVAAFATATTTSPTPAAAPAATAPAAATITTCCRYHQQCLQDFLLSLNWQHLDPVSLQLLEQQQLLSPEALLEVYRAHHQCCYRSLQGVFALNGFCDGLQVVLKGGEQLLECRSQTHLSATASEVCLTSGQHSWQVVVNTSCDLVWVGVSDGTLDPRAWGGRQAGGWFYGSNDALCHQASPEQHAYQRYCGHYKWGEQAVVTVYLDMDAREVWFALDGSEPKLGFTELPGRVYPSVSIRAPALLGFRFRPGSYNRGAGAGEEAQQLVVGGRVAGSSSSSTDGAGGSSSGCGGRVGGVGGGLGRQQSAEMGGAVCGRAM